MDFEAIIIVFMVIVLPIWIIFHYGSKKHAQSRLTPDDERMLEDLWRSAKEMERRLQALESITELDEPGTRSGTQAGAGPRPGDAVM